jgi:cell division protein FtsQ
MKDAAGEGAAAARMQWATRALLAASLLVLLGGAALWVAQRPWFDIRRIEVRGTSELQHVTAAAVRSAIAGRLRGNFFTVSLDQARNVFEDVPWVARASVRRVWPNRLRVTLTEHRALGLWDDGRLLSDTGELFIANSGEAEIFGPLPEFDGPDQFAAAAAARFYEFSALLAPLSLSIARLSISERGSWSLAADNGPRFELGRDDPPGSASDRLATIVASYPLVVARLNAPPVRFDARYANGFAAAAKKR